MRRDRVEIYMESGSWKETGRIGEIDAYIIGTGARLMDEMINAGINA